mgnify:CR=1 FL=1
MAKSKPDWETPYNKKHPRRGGEEFPFTRDPQSGDEADYQYEINEIINDRKYDEYPEGFSPFNKNHAEYKYPVQNRVRRRRDIEEARAESVREGRRAAAMRFISGSKK